MKTIKIKIKINIIATITLTFIAVGIGTAQNCTISGYVKDGPAGDPLSGIYIEAIGHATFTLTNEVGFYSLSVPVGTVEIRASLEDPVGTSKTIVTTVPGFNYRVDFWMNALQDADGNFYSAVEIGSQVWMGENLRVTHYNNGDPVLTTNPAVLDVSEEEIPLYQWSYREALLELAGVIEPIIEAGGGEITLEQLVANAIITPQQQTVFENWFEAVGIDDPDIKTIQELYDECISLADALPLTYDLLYTWYAAVDNRKLCPDGWHVPSNTEWDILSNTLGGAGTYSEIGGELKEAGVLHWNDPNTGATNTSGFKALPGGTRGISGFSSTGEYGSWWSSTQFDPYDARGIHLHYYESVLYFNEYVTKTGRSVRCLKDKIIVTNTDDSGPGSLRNAIELANLTVGLKETISFHIEGAGPFIIQPTSQLPPIIDPVIIDGYSQPGSEPATASDPATILIEINGENIPDESNSGLYLNAGESSISGLAIVNFEKGISLSSQDDISFDQPGYNIIEGNSLTYNGTGIFVYSSDNTIGGITPAARNIISGNMWGIVIINVYTGGAPGWARNRIIGNYIGVDENGSLLGNDRDGIQIIDSPDNIIGGSTSSERNIISGNNIGISIEYYRNDDPFRNRIEGNYIGTNVDGTAAIGNYRGISIDVPGNFVGGSAPGSGNLISGNLIVGIEMNARANENIIQGNLIGTDQSGSTALPNTGRGICIRGGSNNQIGGTVAGSGNIISGNTSDGIYIIQGTINVVPVAAKDNIIQGNYIGTDKNGLTDLGNGSNGVVIDEGSTNNIIGGGNLISCNSDAGIYIDNGGSNTIIGNYIGTDVSGTLPLGNGKREYNLAVLSAGIGLDASSENTIGGALPTERNIISSNGEGIVLMDKLTGGNLVGSNRNIIKGNYIGIDASGEEPLGNDACGIYIAGVSSGNIIGGSGTGEKNVISANVYGIAFQGHGTPVNQAANNNEIIGNYIGTDFTGLDQLGNRDAGIYIANGPFKNQIGGDTKEKGNIIANSTKYGVLIFGEEGSYPWGNLIASNSIYNNARIGIDLSTTSEYLGVTPNDLGDVDNGPNGFQNFPVLESLSLSSTSGTVDISGTLNSKPGDYTIQFFASKVPDNTGYGEGETYIGSTKLEITEFGDTPFTASITEWFQEYGDVFTAIAIDADGNTSEFSAAIGGLQDQIQPINTISYNINNDIVGSIPFSPAIKDAIISAFDSWSVDKWPFEEIKTTNVNFEYIGDESGTIEKYASANDEVNLVTFNDDRFPFSPGVLAVCAKTLKIEVGDEEAKILDADIVFNPFYVKDPALNFGIEGHSLYDGFFDIQSVATHEIGHALGLIHSGVYNSVMWFEIGPGTEYRTLKQDDKSWLSYRYPDDNGTNYDATYGSISGHITYGENNEPVAGAIVLAIDPDDNMPVVHAYSDAAGDYLIPGLPPGNYNVYITPLDGDVYGRPLRPGNISAYIYCNTEYTDYPGEYYDDDESAEEEDRLDSDEVAVEAGIELPEINFITNVADPTVKSVSPENGSTNVSVLPNILITFSEPVEMSTVNIGSCYLTEAGSSTPIGGTYQPEGFEDNSDIVLFFPQEDGLKYGTTYTLHIIAPPDENQPGIRDLWDNPLDADPASEGIEPEYQVTFTTVQKDNESPTILNISPEDGATNVFLAEEILITFSEPMKKSSVISSFNLTDGANAITFTLSWYEYSSLTIAPDDPLMEGTTYSLSWTGGATDIAGNGLKAGSISFTTVPNAPPTITYLEPGTDLIANVSVETSIVIDFSEPMSTTSIQDNFILHEGEDITGSEVPGTFEFLNNDSRVVFRPDDALEFSTTSDLQYYTLELKGGSPEGICDISDEVGYLAAVLPTTFTTASEPQQPHISSIRPMSGVATSIVRINGYGFDPDFSDTEVKFYSDVEALITDASLTSLTVEVPAGATSGPVGVTVNGTPDDQAPDSWITFFYIIPPSDAGYEAYANTNTGSQSRSATLSYNGATAYVTNSGENTVSVVENLDENPKEVTPRIQVGTTPMMISLNHLGTSAYVTNFNSHDVSVIDLTEGATKYDVVETIEVPPYPYGIASAGNNIYVANSAFVSIINIDPVSGGFDHIVANVNTGSRNRDVAVTSDGGTLVVTGDNGVNIVELIQTELGFDYAVTNVNPGTRTRDVSVTHDNGTAIITTEDGNIFLVGIVRGTSSFGNAYYNYNPKSKAGDGTTSYDGQYYFVTNPDDDQVTVYELLYEDGGTGYNSSSSRSRSLKELMVVPTGMRPEGICNDYDDNKFITANFDSDNITLVTHYAFEEKTVVDLINDLMTTVEDLKNTEVFKETLGDVLLNSINNVLKDINTKKTKSAINTLKSFINQIKGFDNGGQFPPDDTYTADFLIKTAEKIIYLLQHPGSKSEMDESTNTGMDQLQPDFILESKLGTIYPNPFSESVTINFEIGQSDDSPVKVQIGIYDITGRLISTLVDRNMESGHYSTVWNRNYSDIGVSALGVYFVRFRATNTEQVKQIMLVR